MVTAPCSPDGDRGSSDGERPRAVQVGQDALYATLRSALGLVSERANMMRKLETRLEQLSRENRVLRIELAGLSAKEKVEVPYQRPVPPRLCGAALGLHSDTDDVSVEEIGGDGHGSRPTPPGLRAAGLGVSPNAVVAMNSGRSPHSSHSPGYESDHDRRAKSLGTSRLAGASSPWPETATAWGPNRVSPKRAGEAATAGEGAMPRLPAPPQPGTPCATPVFNAANRASQRRPQLSFMSDAADVDAPSGSRPRSSQQAEAGTDSMPKRTNLRTFHEEPFHKAEVQNLPTSAAHRHMLAACRASTDGIVLPAGFLKSAEAGDISGPDSPWSTATPVGVVNKSPLTRPCTTDTMVRVKPGSAGTVGRRSAQFEVHPGWSDCTAHTPAAARMKADQMSAFRKNRPNRSTAVITGSLQVSLSMDDNSLETSTSVEDPEKILRGLRAWFKTRHVLHPHSGAALLWQSTSILLVMYDLVVLPLHLMNLPSNRVLSALVWLTRLFWTGDIVASLFTGYVTSDGGIETRFPRTLTRYLRTWCILDLLIVSIDWLEILMGTEDGATVAQSSSAVAQSSRSLRMLRLIRLLRLARIKVMIEVLSETFRSDKASIMAGIVKNIVFIVGLAHLAGCVWFGIGQAGVGEDSWIAVHGYEDSTLFRRYMMSMHWAISQLAGGMDEVTPANPWERAYAVFCFLVAFLVAALFVSNITSGMTNLNILASRQAQQIAALRRYLVQNSISNKLALRVQRNAQHTMSEQQKLHPKECVELLDRISKPLRMEIHFEMFSPILQVHPFFRVFIEEFPHIMIRVCHHATRMEVVAEGDIVFNMGEFPSAPKMYFVVSGHLEYTSISGEVESLKQGDWVSEGSLWTPWMHRGTLAVINECRLLELDAFRFQEVVTRFDANCVSINPKLYAQRFVKDLNSRDTAATDLPTGFEEQALRAAEDPHFLSKPTRARQSLRPLRQMATRASHTSAMPGTLSAGVPSLRQGMSFRPVQVRPNSADSAN